MTREQFIAHVRATQKEFRRFLTALGCGDVQLADDIAQEAYLKAYLACDGFDEEKKFKAWIFRIGYTTFIDYKRSAPFFADVEEARGLSSAEATDGAFRYQALYEALGKLPPRERTSVLLYYMEGYSIKETAEIVGASTDAVKKHLSRGRMHLRNLLNDD